MPSCCVKWCGKNTTTSNYTRDGITFHRFPKLPEIKEKWIEATHRENWFPTNTTVICSRHFSPDYFDYKTKRRRLFASAVPTLFLPVLKSRSEFTASSEDEEPSTSVPKNKEEDSPDETILEAKNAKILIENDLKNINSMSKKVLRRQIEHLLTRQKEKTILVKSLRDSNRRLKAKVISMKSLIEKLKKKELVTQENIDVDRLRNSNRQLRKRVIFLKRLLNEQKMNNLASRQNTVWCSTGEDGEGMVHSEL